MNTTSPTLSAQEAAIECGKKVMHGTVSDRVLRIFEAIRTAGPPRVALERAVCFTESFKTTEGQPLVWRCTKALQHIAENISVAILGNTTQWTPRREEPVWSKRPMQQFTKPKRQHPRTHERNNA